MKKTKEQVQQCYKEIALTMLKKIAGRSDYSRAKFHRKKDKCKPKHVYLISCFRGTHIYLQWEPYTAHSHNFRLSHKMTVKELKENYVLIKEQK